MSLTIRSHAFMCVFVFFCLKEQVIESRLVIESTVCEFFGCAYYGSTAHLQHIFDIYFNKVARWFSHSTAVA